MTSLHPNYILLYIYFLTHRALVCVVSICTGKAISLLQGYHCVCQIYLYTSISISLRVSPFILYHVGYTSCCTHSSGCNYSKPSQPHPHRGFHISCKKKEKERTLMRLHGARFIDIGVVCVCVHIQPAAAASAQSLMMSVNEPLFFFSLSLSLCFLSMVVSIPTNQPCVCVCVHLGK